MAYIDNVTNILQIQPDGLPTFVRLSQNENGRNLYFQLAGNEIDIPANATITISGTKPDGTVYSGTGSISDNVILIPEMIQMTAVAGYWDAKVKIISGGNTIATGRIRFVIDADTVDPDAVPSDSELEGLVAEAQQYAETARTEAYGSPLTATTAAGMADHTRVYVYTGSETGYTAGHWYYWDGTQWTDGGIYNSTAVNTDPTLTLAGVAADAKATGDAIEAARVAIDDTLTNEGEAADAAAVGSEISGLKEDLNTLDGQINGTQTLVPTSKTVSDFTQINFYINYITGKWVSATNRAYIGALGDCVKVSITANTSYAAQIALLGDGTPSDGETANIVGTSLPTIISAGQSIELDVPETATQIYVRRIDQDGHGLVPSSMIFYSYESSGDGIVGSINALEDDIEELRHDLDSIAMSDMGDTSITNPANGQILEYNETTSKWENTNTLKNLKDSVTVLDGQINGTRTLVPTTKTVSDFTAIDYYIGTNAGKWVAATNRAYIISLGDTSKVSITANTNKNAQIAFLSSNEMTEGDYADIVGDTMPTIVTAGETYTHDVPNEAAYFYMRRIDPDGYNLVPSSIVFYSYSSSGDGIADNIEQVQTEIAEIQTEMEDIGGIEYEWIDGYKISSYSFNNPSNRGLYEVDSDQSIAISDIRAFAGGVINGHTQMSDGCGYAFYDVHGEIISYGSKPSGAPYSWDFANISVPSSAKKVAITCRSTYKNTFAIEGTGFIYGITNTGTEQAIEYDIPDGVFGLDSAKSDFHYDSETRLNDVYDWYDILKCSFPRNISKVQIGTTTTPIAPYSDIDNSTYPIYAYIIQGDRYISGNDFILTSGIHGDGPGGDGIQSVVALAYFIRDMLSNPQKNRFLSFMKYNCKILVVPVLNPWGYQNGYRGNGRNVDINRNFDYNFVPDVIAENTTSGPEAFSENESVAIATYLSENFSNAKFLHDFHTRGGDVWPTDDRWFTNTTVTNTKIQEAVTASGYWMRRLYGGTVSNNTQAAVDLHATLRGYTDQVIGVPSVLMECLKSVDKNIITFNSDMVQRQYTQYLGSLVQAEVNAMIIED